MSNAAALRCRRLNILGQPVLSKERCLSDRHRAKENAALRRFEVKVGGTAFCICYTHHDHSDTFLNQGAQPSGVFQGTLTDSIRVSVLIRRI